MWHRKIHGPGVKWLKTDALMLQNSQAQSWNKFISENQNREINFLVLHFHKKINNDNT